MKIVAIAIYVDKVEYGADIKEHLLAWYAPAIEDQSLDLQIEIHGTDESDANDL